MTTTQDVEGVAGSEGSASRRRLGLEAVRPFPFPNDPSLLPSVEAGIRNDGGDAETGFGLDIGAALAWDDPHHGISAELRGRSLVTHVAEVFRQQGMALSFAWRPPQPIGDPPSPYTMPWERRSRGYGCPAAACRHGTVEWLQQ